MSSAPRADGARSGTNPGGVASPAVLAVPAALRADAATLERIAPVIRLFDPVAVRSRSAQLLARARAGDSAHFQIVDERLVRCAAYVLETIRQNYPDLDVPFHSRWRHFSAGGVDRWAQLEARIGATTGANDIRETARIRFDLAITSVLLDAGAGADWAFVERGRRFTRSEGLAVASWHAFAGGAFAADPARPWRADAGALASIDGARLARVFQVDSNNPMVGLDGRAELIARLGGAIAAQPEYFGSPARIGNLADWCFDHAAPTTPVDQERRPQLHAATLLGAVLWSLRDAWPVRHRLAGLALGDVWPHPAVRSDDASAGWMPFHKLSQWLTYSLIEPLQDAGLVVTGIDALTGLPEYRNGGLLLDCGLLLPRASDFLSARHRAGDEAIVEWRALTVALLDEIGALVRMELGLTSERFPLARVLEGGTWQAGRRIARERRADGGPPVSIESDGTVF